MSGPLATFLAHLALAPAPPGAVRLTALADPATIGPLLEDYARTLARPDRRGAASIWIKYYCRALLAPAIALAVRDRVPLVGAGGDPALVTAAARPRSLAIDAMPAAAATEEIYGPLLSGHLPPLFAAIARVSRLSPRVAWSNAGNLIEFLFRELASVPGLGETVQRDRALVIGARANAWFPDGNPLHEPLRAIAVVDGAARAEHRQRKICCVRYLLDQPLCTTCPRLSHDDLVALWRRKKEEEAATG